jgi:hypothetical protein
MALTNLQDCVSNGAIESAGTFDGWRYQIRRVVLMDGTTKSAELHRRGTTKLHIVITHDWRYEICRVVLQRVLQNLTTQCAIEWRYKLAPAIKGFKFMTPLDG